MDRPASQVQFEVSDPALAGLPAGLLGVWTPTAPAGPVSFGVGDEEADRPPVWRVHLPPSFAEARAGLDASHARVDRSGAALGAAELRLEHFTAAGGRALLAQRAQTVSFDVGDEGAAGVEAELATVIGQLGRPAGGFNLGEAIGGGWAQTRQQFQDGIDALTRSLANYAWVETRAQQRLQARTSVSWTGQLTTVLQAGVGPQQAELHRQALALAVRSRSTLLRSLGMVIQASLLLTTPGGQLLALPVLWRFVNQWLADVGRHQ